MSKTLKFNHWQGLLMSIILSQVLYSCGANTQQLEEIGIKQYEKDSIEMAINTFDKAIKLNDTCYRCYIYQGFAYKDLKKYNEALNCFYIAISLKPYRAEGYAN